MPGKSWAEVRASRGDRMRFELAESGVALTRRPHSGSAKLWQWDIASPDSSAGADLMLHRGKWQAGWCGERGPEGKDLDQCLRWLDQKVVALYKSIPMPGVVKLRLDDPEIQKRIERVIAETARVDECVREILMALLPPKKGRKP